MAGIKRTPADTWFSRCVRARANFTCERCGAVHTPTSQGLHCSHHHRRGQWAVRFDPGNAEALCYGCHVQAGGTADRLALVVSEAEQARLRALCVDQAVARRVRRTHGRGAIAAHFKAEYERLMALRDDGRGDRLDFRGWDDA